jgi:succinate dehydrogenase/fumarate reductase flavoprotein subunit
MTSEEKTDVLIIGAGIAGIRAAIEAAEHGVNVILTTKGAFCRDGAASWMAGNAFQAALYGPDSVDHHVKDTIVGGKFLNNQTLVKTFLEMGPKAVKEMHRWGMRLSRWEGRFYQIPFPGHSYPRSVCGKPGLFLGPEYRKTLLREVRRRGIRVDDDLFFSDLLRSDGEVTGAVGLDVRKGKARVYRAKSTILATGGFMGCYEFTTASRTATGDGHGMAYRAGAKMMDMEFVQFIPSVTLWPASAYGDPYPYLMWVGLHPMFYNSLGERFLERYYPDVKDWATREAVARAIVKEVRAGRGSPHGGAYMSFRHLPRNLIEDFLEKASGVDYLTKLKEGGIDVRYDGIEVGPGAHYVQGGCWIDEKCETSLPGLYAVGEVGSGGKDGADRLAGNSITFCIAMGTIAGAAAAQRAETIRFPRVRKEEKDKLVRKIRAPLERKDGTRPLGIKKAVRKIMSQHAFVERDGEGLGVGLRKLEEIRARDLQGMATVSKDEVFNMEWADALEAQNMVDVAEMVCRAALVREESRGLHQRGDFPNSGPAWLRHILIEKTGRAMKFSTVPVEFPLITPE